MHGDDADIDEPVTEEQRQQILQNEQNFTPDPEAARQLGEMGFGQRDVTRALRMSRNNQDAALAWLLSDQQGAENEEDLVEGEEGGGGLEQMVEALLGNMGSGVQSERVLEALQRILRDPQTATEYINDPEIGPILRQIQNLINTVDVDEEDDIGGDDLDDIGDRLGNGGL